MTKISVLICLSLLILSSQANQLRARQHSLVPMVDQFLEQPPKPNQVATIELNDTPYAVLDQDERLHSDYDDSSLGNSQTEQAFIAGIHGAMANALNESKGENQQNQLFQAILNSFQESVGNENDLLQNAVGDIQRQQVTPGPAALSQMVQQAEPSLDMDEFGQTLAKQLITPLTQTVEYRTTTNSIFDFRDIDDDELVRTDSGIYNIIYQEDVNGLAAIDFDERIERYDEEVDELIRDLDEAEEDLDEDLKKDRDESDELNDINNQPGNYLTEGDREDIDDLTDKLYDAIQDFNDDTKDYTQDEIDMLRDDDIDEGSEQARDIVESTAALLSHSGIQIAQEEDCDEVDEVDTDEKAVVVEEEECEETEVVVVEEEECEEAEDVVEAEEVVKAEEEECEETEVKEEGCCDNDDQIDLDELRDQIKEMQEEEQDEQMKRRQELIESKRHPNIKDDSDDFVHLINLSGSLPLEYAEFDEAMGIAEISLSERNVQVSDDFDDQPYDDRLQAGNLITQRIYAQPQ